MNMTFPPRMHFSHFNPSTHPAERKKSDSEKSVFLFHLSRKLFAPFLLLHRLTKETNLNAHNIEQLEDIAHLFSFFFLFLLPSNFHLPLILFQPLLEQDFVSKFCPSSSRLPPPRTQGKRRQSELR